MEVFLTALLLAEPCELREPAPQLHVDSLETTGWKVPKGWYGFAEASGPGLISVAKVDPVAGLDALRRMGEPEMESRSQDFEGRRLVRINGGYIVLNWQRYRDKDYSAALRQKRYRERLRKIEEEKAKYGNGHA